MNEDSTNTEVNFGNKPPKLFKRNSFGLLTHIDYIFDEHGFVDYRKMLKPEHLAPNDKKTKEKDVTKLPDSDLIILLSGIKYLAFLRGFSSVNYKSMTAHPSYVAVQCSIKWIPNYETLDKEMIFESIADASTNNTDGIASLYLASIAENRAFARAVRNFLKINIVSKEELKNDSPSDESNSQVEPSHDVSSDPYSLLKNLMEEVGIAFQVIKDKLINENHETAHTWTQLSDIPKPTVFALIGRIQEKIKEREKKKSLGS